MTLSLKSRRWTTLDRGRIITRERHTRTLPCNRSYSHQAFPDVIQFSAMLLHFKKNSSSRSLSVSLTRLGRWSYVSSSSLLLLSDTVKIFLHRSSQHNELLCCGLLCRQIGTYGPPYSASVWAPMEWLTGTRNCMRLYVPLSYLDINALIRLSLSILHFSLDDEFGSCFRIIHTYSSLNSPSRPTYTFNSVVFHSRFFSARPRLQLP